MQQNEKPVEFSKLDFLATCGLLDRNFNFDTLQFESSLRRLLWSFLVLAVQETFLVSFYVSPFFENHDLWQLAIGSPYNYLEQGPKAFVGVMGLIVTAWVATLYLHFNYSQTKDGNRLMIKWIKWMKMTYEIPAKSDRDYQVFGLSVSENKKFWLEEKRMNARWYRYMNYVLFFYLNLLNLQFTFVTFDVDLWIFVLVQVFHALHYNWALWAYLHSVYTVNLFFIQCIRFFLVRFRYIANHLETMTRKNEKRLDIVKLRSLILDFNRVQFELIEMNNFWKDLTGWSVIYFMSFGIILAFIAINVDVRLELILFAMILVMYLTGIYGTFALASQVPHKIFEVNHLLSKLSFRKTVNIATKLKIDSINNLGAPATFTCFTWFHLDSFVGLKISLEFITLFLLLIQTYYLYANF